MVRFSGIKYSRKLVIPSNGYETFGNKVLGCFVGPFRTLLQRKESTWLHILKGVDGYIMPGSMTLLLGPPGKNIVTQFLANDTYINSIVPQMTSNSEALVLVIITITSATTQ